MSFAGWRLSYEISALVHALNAEAVSALGEFLRKKPSDADPTLPRPS
jgi:hypothetical protein